MNRDKLQTRAKKLCSLEIVKIGVLLDPKSPNRKITNEQKKILKLLAATSFTAIIAPVSFAQTLPRKIIMAIKNGKYPGKIKPINEAVISKEGIWRG